MTSSASSARGAVWYGAASMLVSLLIMSLLLDHGCQWLLAVMVPISTGTLFVTKRSYLLVLVPGAVFFAIVLGDTQAVAILDSHSMLLVFACIALFALVTRWGHFGVPVEAGVPSPRSATRAWTTGTSENVEKPMTYRSSWAEYCGLCLVVISVGIAYWWTAPLQRGLPPAHHIGLVGEAYLGIQILLTFAATLVGLSGLVHYVRRQRTLLARSRDDHQDLLDDAGAAKFSLQEETWRWQRGEQLRVARSQSRARSRVRAKRMRFQKSP